MPFLREFKYMKISTAITFLIIVSAVFAIYGLMVHEANNTYTGKIEGFTPINTGNWSSSNNGWNGQDSNTGQFDFLASINGTLGPLQEKFTQIKDPDLGFFTKLVAGISAIPYAIVLVPDVLFNALFLSGALITAFLTALSVPSWFIVAGCVLLLIWGIFKLLEYYQRVPI